MIQFP